MSPILLSLLFFLSGLLVGATINALADDLPQRARPRLPHCPQCGHSYPPAQWLALLRWRAACPQCALPARRRAPMVEATTALLFAALPWLVPDPITRFFTALYSAILILIIVIDLEHFLILHVVTLPGTALALLATFVIPDQNWRLALAGAVSGFLLFFLFYWIGQLLFGAGALGFGDVTLSLLLGAMLGFDRIFFALLLGIVLGGISSLIFMALRRRGRFHIPYGPYLAVSGIIMLIWGRQVFLWYTS